MRYELRELRRRAEENPMAYADSSPPIADLPGLGYRVGLSINR